MTSDGPSGKCRPDTSRPECPSGEGHAWVSGRAELTDDGLVRIVSRQCRRCGYEDVIEDG